MEGASGCRVRWLIGEGENAPNFAMREFEVQPGGHTPKHFHDYEHEVYVLAGKGTIVDGDQEKPLAAGDVVFVSPNDVHQFKNTGCISSRTRAASRCGFCARFRTLRPVRA
jgi:quercetin dioxygenase-like cupin family protein